MKHQLTALFSYTDWANRRLLDAASLLSEEQFTRDIIPGFGSIHRTLVHMVGAEALWFARWQGASPRKMLSPDDLPTAEAVREQWASLMARRQENLAGMDEADFAAVVQWTNMRGQSFALPRWQVMLHCANHATHHRSEIAAILSELGYEPPNTDLLKFFLEQAGHAWEPSRQS